ncbi:unnamed protein product [Pleuronectes platessa]|uniref:Uncharacterized protein n=1 Tax=Pleuronectes platessa TaxID=8262 RepID=A0A9N7UML4_PLEPL|nr:unnamed protein product [Pleuronectes platessa]
MKECGRQAVGTDGRSVSTSGHNIALMLHVEGELASALSELSKRLGVTCLPHTWDTVLHRRREGGGRARLGWGTLFLKGFPALSAVLRHVTPRRFDSSDNAEATAETLHPVLYGEWIVPNLRIPWKRRRSSLPYIAVGTCEILNGINWDYRRETSGDVTATAWEWNRKFPFRNGGVSGPITAQVLSVGCPSFRRIVRKMSAARKALRGASERHGEGVPRWRGRSYLSVSVKTQKHTLAFKASVCFSESVSD